MDKLPEVIQDKIKLNNHELKFVDTLNVAKQRFDDDVELTPDQMLKLNLVRLLLNVLYMITMSK